MPGNFVSRMLRKSRNSDSGQQHADEQSQKYKSQPRVPERSDNIWQGEPLERPGDQKCDLSRTASQTAGDKPSSTSKNDVEKHPQHAGLFRRFTSRLISSARGRQAKQLRHFHQAPEPMTEALPASEEASMLLRTPSPMRLLLSRTITPMVHRQKRTATVSPVSIDCGPLADTSDNETLPERLTASTFATKQEPISLLTALSSISSNESNSRVDDFGDKDSDSQISDCVLRLRMATTATDSRSNNNGSRRRSRRQQRTTEHR